MIPLRIQLVLRSGLGTPLAADTLWGHLCWGLRYQRGERALVDWLAEYDAGRPPLVISDPLPSGFIPRPALPAPPRPADAPGDRRADQTKQRSKAAWVPLAQAEIMARRLGHASLDQALQSDQAPPELVEAAVIHAAINRLTGGTAQAGGGTLHNAEQSYAPDDARFDVWALSATAAADVAELFDAALCAGYGRDAASGLGHLKVESVSEQRLPAPENPDAGILLAHAVPKPGDPHRGFARLAVRCGRLGGDFAIHQTPGGSVQRQKRPVHCLRPGSVLVGQPMPAFVGRVVAGVHEDPVIRHYGLAPVLPCRLEPSLAAETSA